MRVLLVLALVGYARCLPLQVSISSYIHGQVVVYHNVSDWSMKYFAKILTYYKETKKAMEKKYTFPKCYLIKTIQYLMKSYSNKPDKR